MTIPTTLRLLILSTLLSVGCAKSGPQDLTCGEKECAQICADTLQAADKPKASEKTALALTAFEEKMLSTVITDLRAGVHPFNKEGLGLCEGQGKACEKFLGMKAGTLPPGKYMVRAELAVPNIGPKGSWSIEFKTECVTTQTTPSGDVKENRSSRSRSFNVAYAGQSRGYRLSPLYTISSPNKDGEQTCKYQIIAPHPDGDKVYEGSWTVPKG